MTKESKISEELQLLTARLLMTRTQGEIVKLSGEFNELIKRAIEIEDKSGVIATVQEGKTVSAEIKFTKEELKGVDKDFLRMFNEQGRVVRVIKRRSGKKKFLYEIRYRRNGYNISVSSTDLVEAKKKFIDELKSDRLAAHKNGWEPIGVNRFSVIAEEWLDYKADKIAPKTWQSYCSYLRRYINPIIGDKLIKAIRTIDIDVILRAHKETRLYEDLRTVLNSVFKYAINSGIITHNPVTIIPFISTARQTGRALTAEEQRRMSERLELEEFSRYREAIFTMYYFGLRPFELFEAHFENGFLLARNAKRKGGMVEFKKIPIPFQAKLKIKCEGKVFLPVKLNALNKAFKRLMGDENITQYYLRHTFATTAQQYVRPDIVDIWMGDSSERLVGRVYTHFPDNFMQEQMNKVRFEI